MDKLLEYTTNFGATLVHFPRAELFAVVAVMLLVPLVALICIRVRDHRRSVDADASPNDQTSDMRNWHLRSHP